MNISRVEEFLRIVNGHDEPHSTLTASSDFVQFSARETILSRQVADFILLVASFGSRFREFRLRRRQLPQSGTTCGEVGTVAPNHQFHRDQFR
jgi:hypothetical protein